MRKGRVYRWSRTIHVLKGGAAASPNLSDLRCAGLASPHYMITQAQHRESVQKRAIHIIFNFTRGMSYSNVLFVAQLESLETRRNNLSRSFFQDICKPTSSLHHLIPPVRDTSVTTRLKVTTSLPRPNLRTKKYCSFINFGLHRYQPTQ